MQNESCSAVDDGTHAGDFFPPENSTVAYTAPAVAVLEAVTDVEKISVSPWRPYDRYAS